MIFINWLKLLWNSRPFSMKEIDSQKMWIHSDESLNSFQELEKYFNAYNPYEHPLGGAYYAPITDDRQFRHDLIVQHWDRHLIGNLPALTDKLEYRRQLFLEWLHQGRIIREYALILYGWCEAKKECPFFWR